VPEALPTVDDGTRPYSAEQVDRAVRAAYAAFGGSGFGFASWAARIPQVKNQLALGPADLGLVLLAIAAGSVIALPVAGLIVHRWTTRLTTAVMAAVFGAALALVGIGYLVGVVPVVIGLFVLGFANGAWDVAMNVQGADVERHLGRAIMPRFHAGYSLGAVAGALLGSALVALDVSVTVHLCVVAAVVAVGVPVMVRGYLPDIVAAGPRKTDQGRSAGPGVLARWREPRTVLIGLFVLAFAFSEGTGNDWISVAVIDDHHAPAEIGTLCFAMFLAAMTAARWIGPTLLDRYGRVGTVRVLALLAFVGLMVFVFSPTTPLAFVGVVLWGAGTSLGFPVGMSAAADHPAAAAGRVSVVASIGYCAFLGGPPLIGFLGSHVGVLHALTAVAALLAIAALVATTVRPLAP
jgi:MFS family permease